MPGTSCLHSLVLMAVLQLFVIQDSVTETKICNLPPSNGTHYVEETAKSGTVIFNMGQDAGTEWHMKVVWPDRHRQYLETYFNISKEGENWSVTLLKQLDVEIIYNEEGFLISTEPLKIELTCTKNNQMEVFERAVFVVPVNEHPPFFIPPKPVLHVPEEVPIGTFVKDLNVIITDVDAHDPHSWDIRVFQVNSMTVSQQWDARAVFTVTTVGQLIVSELVDYERGQTLYLLNVTVKENNGLQATNVVRIIIDNVNDYPPVFMYLKCLVNCIERHYKATVSNCYMGRVMSFSIGPINAVDPDGETVMYRIVHASPSDAIKYININRELGFVHIVSPTTDVENDILVYVLEAFDSGELIGVNGKKLVRSSYTILLIQVQKHC